eukprot:gene16774-19947_t
MGIVSKAMERASESEYLVNKDYYSGRWASSKANGIGSFHFAKDGSEHQDFWRNGVAIRYLNQGQLASVTQTSTETMERLTTSSEELKKMLEDWKRVMGVDDDFPVAKPYFSASTPNAVSSALYDPQTSQPSLGSPLEDRPSSLVSSVGSNTFRMAKSPNKIDLASTVSASSPGGPLSPSYSDSKVSQTQSGLAPIAASTRQSFGVVTSSYLKNRIENEDKFFISLIMFISKWELPEHKIGTLSTSSNFMIVVPDLETATFLPLCSLVLQCNIVEKMIYRLLSDPNTKQTLGQHTAGTPSSTADERELMKLLPFCLDIERINDSSNPMERYRIEPIISTLKSFTRDIDNFQRIPLFLMHHISDIVSVYKKTKPFEMFLFNSRFQIVQEQFIQLLNKLELALPSTSSSASSTTTSTTPSASIDIEPARPVRPTLQAGKSQHHLATSATIKIGPTLSSTTAGGNTPPISRVQSTISKFPGGIRGTTTGIATTGSGQKITQLQREKTLESLAKQSEQIQPLSKKDRRSMTSSLLDKGIMDFVLQLFLSSFELPSSLEDSVPLLKNIVSSVSSIRTVLLKSVATLKEAKVSLSADTLKKESNISKPSHDQYREYLVCKENQFDVFIEEQEKEVALLETTTRICKALCRELFVQLLNLTLKRLTNATLFIRQIIKASPTHLPRPYTVKYIKHIYMISTRILSTCTNWNDKGNMSTYPTFR